MVCEEFDEATRKLFDTEQIGQFYVVHGQHARGDTFSIQVLPYGIPAHGNGRGNLCLNNESVLVYGQIGGINGWTDRYGWLITGPWQAAFRKIVAARRDAKDKSKQKDEQELAQHLAHQQAATDDRVRALAIAWPMADGSPVPRAYTIEDTYFAMTAIASGAPRAVMLSDVCEPCGDDAVAIFETKEKAKAICEEHGIKDIRLYYWPLKEVTE